MKLNRKKLLLPSGSLARAQAPQCLMWLGLPRKEVYRCNRSQYERRISRRVVQFWDQPYETIMSFYERARTAYLNSLKSGAHPDKGGNTDEAARIISVWKRLETLYRKRGFEV